MINSEKATTTTLPIFTFHSIDDKNSVISFSPRAFEHSVATLYRLGYKTIWLTDLVNCLARGAQFPARACVITFDDGYQSVYKNAFPILQNYQMSATIFLTTGAQPNTERLPSLNERAMLSWNEIRVMHSYGIDFGAHTLTHPDLTQLPTSKTETEMLTSKERIEQMLGAAVTTFAYPFGKFNATCRETARRYFACAVSDRLGFAHPHSDPFALERLETFYLRDTRLFALMPTRWVHWYVGARNVPRQLRRAIHQ